MLAVIIAISLLVQSGLIRFGALAGARFGEGLLAQLREEFVDRVLGLPMSVVERAGSGDLLSRSSRDVASLSQTARYALPATLTAALSVILTLGAIGLDTPLAALAVPARRDPGLARRALVPAPRHRRVPARERGLGADDREPGRDDRGRPHGRRAAARARPAAACERRPRQQLRGRAVHAAAAVGLHAGRGGLVRAAGGRDARLRRISLPARPVHDRAGHRRRPVRDPLVPPIDELIQWLNQLQTARAGLARLLGIAHVAADREPADDRPHGDELVAESVTHAYRRGGRDVLRQVSLRVQPGERIAIVGPSGAGKSTLGRLLAGIAAPSAGTVTVGGVELTRLPLDQLRTRVALVSQEHHIFRGTLRDNLTLGRPDATDDQVQAALAAVEATSWVEALPGGLDCVVGSGGTPLSSARAQQVALARLLLADPHTLILDEATSLLDPRSARRLERSMAAVLDGRTVVSIAHRLHVGHDADRVIVLEDGEIRETGPHRELIAAGGAYAALWRSWHGGTRPASAGDGADAAGHPESVRRH